MARGEAKIVLPRCFWFWLLWAGLEIPVWAFSPQPALGWGEIRHLILLGALFLVLPALDHGADIQTAWKGVFLTSTLSSLFLVGDFFARLSYYRREINAGADVGLHLRSGGLLNHWMVYGTVEILVIAGLLSFWYAYRQEQRRWWPVAAISGGNRPEALERQFLPQRFHALSRDSHLAPVAGDGCTRTAISRSMGLR